MGKAEELTTDNFEEKVVKSSNKILVDFFAPWCGPCQAMVPMIDEIAKEKKGQVYKVNVDQSPELAGKYNVMSIPTVFVFEKGKVIDQMVGPQSKDLLLNKI